jgi:hypothetical protein
MEGERLAPVDPRDMYDFSYFYDATADEFPVLPWDLARAFFGE